MIREIVVASGAALLLASGVRAQPAAADAALVAATIERFHAAVRAGDRDAALRLFADDALILEAGAVETLSAFRAHHLDEDIAFERAVPAKRSAPRVTVQGDVAWAVSESEVAGTFKGRAVNAAGAELVVLTRGAAGWRIRAIHWSSRRR